MAMRMMALMVIVAGSTACAGDKPKPPVAVADSGPPQWAGYVQRSIAAAIGDSTSRIEGITASGGNLYVADWKDGGIYRLSPVANSPAPLAEVERVGQLPTKPGTTIFGVAADKSGNLYFAIPEAGIVYRADGARLGRNFDSRKDVTVFATGMKGANGLGFDANGHLWSSGGDQNVLYHVDAKGGAAHVFAKDYATASSDTTMPVRAFVTNGIAFDKAGNAYTANTGTGEIQRLEVKPGYKPGAITTLVKSPLLLAVVGTTVIAYAVKMVLGLRPTEEVEQGGLDLAEHGEEGYHSGGYGSMSSGTSTSEHYAAPVPIPAVNRNPATT